MSVQDSEVTSQDAQAVKSDEMDIPIERSVETEAERSAETVVVEAVPQIPEPSLAEKHIKLCGVCKENEYKYKCTRCLLP